MRKRKFISFISLAMVFVLTVITIPVNQVFAADPPGQEKKELNLKGKVTPEERKAAGKRFQEDFAAAVAAGEIVIEPTAAGDPGAEYIDPETGLPVPHYFGPYPNYALSPLPTVVTDNVSGNVTSVTGGMRKFVDSLPGLGPVNANNLGQYISVAVPDTTSYPANGDTPAADYYEIALVEYQEQMHSDLPPTTLRGYVQLATDVVPGAVPLYNPDGSQILMPDDTPALAVDDPHYMGPAIIAEKGKPVRIKFYNLLPTGEAGNLFIPVDTTVMGAGMGPVMDENDKPVYYTQNRATVHLHGGITPWISDGTPHQWITPANENTPYPQGVSVSPVPDMDDTGDPHDGVMTFYYTNQQSARLMFYHDHAFGITRLNVYAGEAAAYLIQDEVEQDLVDRGIIPDDQIALVIQDKTFIPDPTVPFSNIFGDWSSQMAFYDPTWDETRWSGYGGLWFPHVYMPVQNPYDLSGINAFGRWHYGPWFWPPVVPEVGPQPNPYADPANPGYSPLEPPFIPGVPLDSMGMESFFDTPVVNGAAYPYLEVDPKAYRLRILNAANDRFWNLQLYVADPGTVYAPGYTGPGNTEVRMVPATAESGLPADWPTDGREMGVPDPTMVGPTMIQIGNEGGFLPQPVELPNRPVSWNMDQTTFHFGTVDGGTLFLGPAERADVIVDFSAYAGQTLILYNDSPAPFPAWTPQFDYYTGAPDLTDTGGAPEIQPGFGPNTRTIMQIRVSNNTPEPAFDLTALETEFVTTDTQDGVFKRGQNPIIVGQSAYDTTYNHTFPSTWPNWGISGIGDNTLNFETVASDGSFPLINAFPMEPKAIQDEMGEAFDKEYGRMSGFLGLELPRTIAGIQNFVLFPFLSPPVELVVGTSIYGAPIGMLDEEGTQIWKLTHNGVDTHPIHFHMFEVQVINRVAWDNNIILPDPNELGWKETVRISPLMDTIVALRPIVPTIPFDIPNSVRLIDPTQPEGVYLANSTAAEAAGGNPEAFAPNGEPIDMLNHYVNYGWEYVWHCHILSHEEMDMMHGIAFGIWPAEPTNLVAERIGNGKNRHVDLTWTDNSKNETDWIIQRATTSTGPWTTIATLPSTTGPLTGSTVMYTDPIGNTNQVFFYQVIASNTIGDTQDYSDPNLNEGASFPTKTLNSVASNVASWIAVTAPAAPIITDISWAPQGQNNARITITWTDVAGETGYTIQRATNDLFTANLVTTDVGANIATYTTGNVPRNQTFWFRISASNEAGASGWSNVVSITTN